LWTLAQLIARYADTGVELRSIGQEHRAVKRVQDYLTAHYADNIALEQLAAIAELSPFHLIRVFRRQVGLPPHAYLTQVRLKEAKILLALGLPIAQVALLTGFVDQSHLTKHFKRTVGVTPGQYAGSYTNHL
jgi:AraC-like DNA-binding protein